MAKSGSDADPDFLSLGKSWERKRETRKFKKYNFLRKSEVSIIDTLIF